MANPDIISYSSASRQEHAFVKKLMDYLGTKGIEAVADDPNHSEPTMNQWLFRAQWLVLVLTPEAIKSRAVQSLVNTAFDRVRQGHMHGVLALAFSSNPVESEEMPYPSWSTIRTYYVGESNDDHQRVFEKVARTLGYTTASSPVAATSTNNWASALGSRVSPNSRLLPAYPQSPRKQLSPITTAAMIVIALLILFSSTFFVFTFLERSSSASTSTKLHPNQTVSTSTQTANPLSQQTNLTPEQIYKNAMNSTYTYSIKLQQWGQPPSCKFTSDTYQINPKDPTQYTPCMAKDTKLKNFAYQVQITISSNGDVGGLIFRADEELKNFYRFSLDSQGMYRLHECHPCDDTSPSNGIPLNQKSSTDTANPIGQANILTVIALNATIYLYVNKTLIEFETLDDSAITGPGEIGLYAYSTNQSATVAFSHVEVWKLPDSGKL